MFEQMRGELVGVYSTRNGGVSKGVYASMNLSFSTGDDEEKVRRNYEIWCDGLGVDPRATVMVRQTHSAEVIAVDETMCGMGLYAPRISGVDGMVTDRQGVALVTSHADCAAIYLYDPVRRAIGLAHAGWRGTVAEIAGNTVRRMTEAFGTKPEDLYAVVGPCISQQYFACDHDVIEAIEQMTVPKEAFWYYDEEEGKYHVSLKALNRAVLQAAGVSAERIAVEDACTYAREDLYFSHRRQGLARGGQAALLMLR